MAIDKTELIVRAKEYMDCLANGTDPISGKSLSRDDPMGSERLARCFSFISGILSETIEARRKGQATATPQKQQTLSQCTDTLSQELRQEDPVLAKSMRAEIVPETLADEEKNRPAKKMKKQEFSLTEEEVDTIPVTEQPVNLSEMVRRLLDASSNEELSDLSNKLLGDGLHYLGFLEYSDPTGKKHTRIPTKNGYEIGFTRVQIINSAGQPYMLNVLEADGQRYLLEHLNEILEGGRQTTTNTKAAKARIKAKKLLDQAQAAMEAAQMLEIR